MVYSSKSADAPAITTPAIDTICVGGASIVFTVCYLLFRVLRPINGEPAEVGEIVVANILINWPHFMASYRILYSDKANVRRHPWVSVVLPCVLVVMTTFAILTAGQNPPELAGLARQGVLDVLYPFAVILLAWHYTGQSWGMTATFAHIQGVRFSRSERLAIRSGYWLLLCYHLLWVTIYLDLLPLMDFLYPGLAGLVVSAYDGWSILLILSFVAGAMGFWSAARRHPGRSIFRSQLPWVATYGWYVLISWYPHMFFVLQIAHALQYLAFPLRVERNQYAHKNPSHAKRAFRHTLLYYVCLVLIGAVVFDGLKLSTANSDPRAQLSMLFSLAINIHHYFMDGVIWKLRRPEVRQALFGHLESAKS